MPETTIFFIVDGKKLEFQSLLLVSSLWHHNGDKFKYIAYAPERYFSEISSTTRKLFEQCNVELKLLPETSGLWRREYPHGNKIVAAAQKRETKNSLFLDTDICCCSEFQYPDVSREQTVIAVPEGVKTWGADLDRWERAYRFFGLPFPEDRVRLVRWGRKEFVPYFNAGFIGFPETVEVDGKRFGELWLETAIEFDFNAKIGGKRPWLDQITLPLTMKRFGYEYLVMSDQFNFSTKNRTFNNETPTLIHYHRDTNFVNWPDGRRSIEVLHSRLSSLSPD